MKVVLILSSGDHIVSPEIASTEEGCSRDKLRRVELWCKTIVRRVGDVVGYDIE